MISLCMILLWTALFAVASAQRAGDIRLTGWYSDMFVDERAGMDDPPFLCIGEYVSLNDDDGPYLLDGSGKTCYMNPIASDFRDPTVIWFQNGNKMDTEAPGFTMYAVALARAFNVSDEYYPTCDDQGICSDCSNFDPVRQGWNTATEDQTCDILGGGGKLCSSTSFYDFVWNVTDCSLVTTVSDNSGIMMASWELVNEQSSAGNMKVLLSQGSVTAMLSVLVIGAMLVL